MSTAVRTAPRVPFVAALAGAGGRTAVVGAGGALSYAELAARVERRARDLGDGRRLVMIAGRNGLDTLVAYLGALHGGHVPWLVPDVAEGLLRAYRPDVIVRAHGWAAGTIEHRNDAPAHDLHPELALLLSTSGSTGAPRLVRLSHENLQANADAIARSLEITPSDRAVTSLPMHYCYGLSVVNSHLLAGARIVLTDASVADEGFWELMRREGGTSFAGVPHTFDLLERTGFADRELPRLRLITQAGGAMAPERVRRYAELGARRGWRLVVMYGQTEATARMAYLPAHLAAAHPGSIGVPIPGGDIRLRPVPEAGEPGVGEIVYRGPNVMLGYADAPEDFALPRVVEELRTGDLGRRGPDGLLEVVGRRSRFVKLYGLRIDLGAVERGLEAAGVPAVCAGTDEGLVVAVPPEADRAEVARLVAGRLGIPARRVRVDHHASIPRLPNGKPDYAAIARPPAGGADDGEGAPQDVGASVAAVFREVLDLRQVRDDDTFAGLGGDSLSYVEMSIALEEVLGHVPPEWPRMTVGELAALRRRPGRMTRVEGNVALRAAATLLVVASHMTAFWPAGGAHLLLAIAGYNFARFGLAATAAPRRLARSLATVARIAVPTSAWIGLQMLLAGGYSVGALLLVNNYTGAPELTGRRWEYWFLEAIVQILLVLAALLSIPRVRRLERAAPLAFALALLAVAILMRGDLMALGDDANRIFRPHSVLWLFLLGWVVQRADTPARRLVASLLVLATVPGWFGQAPREAVIAGGLLLLAWVPVVVVPRPLNRLIGMVAGASLYIYLTHWQVWPLLDPLPLVPAMALTVAAGIATWLVVRRLSVLLARLRARRATARPEVAAGPRGPAPADAPA